MAWAHAAANRVPGDASATARASSGSSTSRSGGSRRTRRAKSWRRVSWNDPVESTDMGTPAKTLS
ncbi:hypothetical protein [Paraoerskovia sediminicola]|uniref:hypothetical protein n=1 Tax=Paraoerskovia sediminicola TaxID=1138587 RepID=UPI00257252F0|nr:hypothetical protein [Paraoerskovia sediminicola]